MPWKIGLRPGKKTKQDRHRKTYKYKGDARKYRKVGEPIWRVKSKKK